mmetsp:Transcript_19707/g.41326  ORF Transcript_19707/g.41326 Transcript_19707/m.41326 type:complete len:262 (+) Transcript_19707:292-1077(+)
MFGFGKKVIVEEVVVPPTRASAAIELLQELAAPIKDYIPLIVVENIILISVLSLMFAVYVLLGEYPSRRTVILEKEAAAVSEEAIPREIGEEVTHVEYVEMVATSSSSSSGLDDDDYGDDDDSSVSDVVQEDIIRSEIIEDNQSVEESYNDFIIKASMSEDSDFRRFEAEVAIIENPSSTPGNNAPSEELSTTKASSSSPSRATKTERTTFNISRTSPKGAKNLTRGRSMKMRKSTSSNSLGNLKRNLSFNKLSSVKKIFK